MIKLAGFGNPLLDITVKLDNDDLLIKYDLREDDQSETNKDLLKSLLKDISKFELCYSPGGSVQNTLRVLQWLLKTSNSIFMFGGIGNDEQGENLKKIIEESGVITRYTIVDGEPTGTVVALTKGHNRSLVAYLGAAERLSIKDFRNHDVEYLWKDVDHFYMEGFFVTKRQELAKYIQSFCKENNKKFIFNLSAPYIVKENIETVNYLAYKCDILFGNKKEFNSLKEKTSFEGSPEEFTLHLLKNYESDEKEGFRKIVVVTNGSKWVLCAHSDNVVEKIKVPHVESNRIVDTTGAGDAFSAGFLAGIFIGKSPKESLEIALWAAAQIIQQSGCSIPSYSVSIEDILERFAP